jgi:outer membrane lipoprotein-sorting protein
MQRKKIMTIIAAVVLVAALTAGIAVARAQGGSDLPSLTPTELLAKVAESAPKAATVSGDVAWTNDLLGPLGLLLAPSGGSAGGSGIASLLQSGSGRMWLDGGKVRLESQSSQGDTAMVTDGINLWVYSSQAGTATEYALPAKPETGTATGAATGDSTASPTAGVDLPAKIQDFINTLAPDATLVVDQVKVAGRAAYLLTMTPTATNTVIGSAQVAIDGSTFVPLQVQVFAKGDAKPVLSAGFTRVSYDPIAAGVFDFTPPQGAKVEHKSLTLPDTMIAGVDPGVAKDATDAAPLTLAEAQTQAGFTLLTPASDALAFKGAHVMPASEAGASGSPALGGGAPVAILQYGEGFGSVFLVETTISAADLAKVTAELAKMPVLGTPVPVGPHAVYQVGTRLGAAMAFAENGTVVFAAGSVSQADLAALVARIK